MAITGTFGEPRAKHGGKVLTLHGWNALVGADDLAPNQELNVMVCTLPFIQELGQVNNGDNFRFERTYWYWGWWDEACGNTTDTVVSAGDHNTTARGIHVNLTGAIEARSTRSCPVCQHGVL